MTRVSVHVSSFRINIIVSFLGQCFSVKRNGHCLFLTTPLRPQPHSPANPSIQFANVLRFHLLAMPGLNFTFGIENYFSFTFRLQLGIPSSEVQIVSHEVSWPTHRISIDRSFCFDALRAVSSHCTLIEALLESNFHHRGRSRHASFSSFNLSR